MVFVILFREALIKAEGIVSNARKSVTESVEKRFNQRFLRTCLHKKCMRIFEHNFVADKAKIRRRAAARQGFLTQYAAKFAEKACAYAYEDRFLYFLGLEYYPAVCIKAQPL